MKKALMYIVLAAAMMIALAACSSGEQAPGDSGTPNTESAANVSSNDAVTPENTAPSDAPATNTEAAAGEVAAEDASTAAEQPDAAADTNAAASEGTSAEANAGAGAVPAAQPAAGNSGASAAKPATSAPNSSPAEAAATKEAETASQPAASEPAKTVNQPASGNTQVKDTDSAAKPADSKTETVTKKEDEPAATAVVAPPAPAKTTAKAISPKNKKLLLIGRAKDPKDDAEVASRLAKLGFRVTKMEDKDFTAAKANQYDMLYVSNTVNSKFVKDGALNDVKVPILVAKNHAMFYLGLSSIEENADAVGVTSIEITNSKHEAAAGGSGKVKVYTQTRDQWGLSYGIPNAKGANVIATVPGDAKKATIYYYDKGTKTANGHTLKSRVSFIYYNGLPTSQGSDLSADGWKQFEQLAVFTLQNQ